MPLTAIILCVGGVLIGHYVVGPVAHEGYDRSPRKMLPALSGIAMVVVVWIVANAIL